MTEPPANPLRTPLRGFAFGPAFPVLSAARTPRTPSFSEKGYGTEERQEIVTPIRERGGSGGGAGGTPHEKAILAMQLARTPSRSFRGFAPA